MRIISGVCSSIFYETFVLFKEELAQLCNYFDEGGVRMKSFVDTMPKEARRIYEEVLVKPVIKEYSEKLRQIELEKERAEKQKERAEKHKERAEREKEREKAERERERERAERERERAEKELRMTCQEVVANRFPDISSSALMAVNRLSFSKCNQLLKELDRISDAHECEAFLKSL